MRRLVLVVMIVLLGFAPGAGFAQTPPAVAGQQAPAASAGQPPAKAVPAPVKQAESWSSMAPSLSMPDDTGRLLAIGLSAIAGTVVLTVVSSNLIGFNALANLGKGVVVFAGTVGGALIANWLYAH